MDQNNLSPERVTRSGNYKQKFKLITLV